MSDITPLELEALRLAFQPLIGLQITWLSIPHRALPGFEPSQIAVIVNTLLDAILPQLEQLATDEENARHLGAIGLSKSPGAIGQRESYPDYIHASGKRVELKGLFVDNPALMMKRPPTAREASARIKENVTLDVIHPESDALLVAAAQLSDDGSGECSPYIVDLGVFSMVECVRARDARLSRAGGRWMGGIPQVVKKKSRQRFLGRELMNDADFEKDTNFGKLSRIPYLTLQNFIRKHGGKVVNDDTQVELAFTAEM